MFKEKIKAALSLIQVGFEKKSIDNCVLEDYYRRMEELSQKFKEAEAARNKKAKEDRQRHERKIEEMEGVVERHIEKLKKRHLENHKAIL